MSTTDTTPGTVLSSVESNEPETVEKQSFIQRRIVTPIKKHPKIALAVGGGLALVGVAAFAGRATAPDVSDSEPSTDELAGLEEAVSEDTTVA